uniref:Rap1 GTPase-activating protein 2-like n=1 Tax=Mastacembelus armatus TaxID=205130 RepID=A0A7N8X4L5_9TELE
MEREKRNDTSFSRKRSFTFGAYGGVDRFTCGDETRPESTEDNILDNLDSPVTEKKPFLSTSINQRDTELFEIIEKLQGSRINEQRCEFPLPLKWAFHDHPNICFPKQDNTGPYLHYQLGGYWVDPPLERVIDVSPTSSHFGFEPESYDIMERDGEAKIYHEFFCSRYHHSFTAVDPSLGPLVLSVCLEEEENKLRVILRWIHLVILVSYETCLHVLSFDAGIVLFLESPSSMSFSLVLQAPELITAFDEHRVSPNFKFGILYQKDGQFTEEDILSNNDESEEFKEFLSILGETIQLQGFTGFRGGLDVCHGQTGSEAVFTSFHGREIMFHVATKLPFTEGDPQQLQRKRHIGNDIVALVYQEGQTPFLSDVIKSHFLHCFLVQVQTSFIFSLQVSVTAREDVPPFGPVLPDPPVFKDHSLLREFLLTKLINAEISCYKAEQFSRLELRTRSSLLESLQTELSTRSQCMMGHPGLSALSSSEGVRGGSEGSGGFIENFKVNIGSSGSHKPKVKLTIRLNMFI